MKKLLFIIFLVFISCKFTNMIDFKKVNIKSGTELVEYQTKVFYDYKSGIILSADTIKKMHENVWVMAAEETAPNNIVIRQWTLLDLLDGVPTHRNKLYKIIDMLSYGTNGDRIWAEGYSYWIYSRQFMRDWVVKFDDDNKIAGLIEDIDNGFIKTAYKRGDKWYPAPIGDTRDEPLFPFHQEQCVKKDSITVSIVSMKRIGNEVVYNVEGIPFGMNHHVFCEDKVIRVIDGATKDFVFYTGMENKYPNNISYVMDVIDNRRLESIKRFNKKYKDVKRIEYAILPFIKVILYGK